MKNDFGNKNLENSTDLVEMNNRRDNCSRNFVFLERLYILEGYLKERWKKDIQRYIRGTQFPNSA